MGLHRNGWWPAFVVSIVWSVALLLDEGGAVAAVIGTSAAVLSATYFCLAVGPFLGGWRQSLGDESSLVYLATSALLCGGLLGWTVLTLPGLFFGAAYLVGADSGSQTWSDLLPALDYVIDGVSSGVIVLAWLSGMACCVWGRLAFLRPLPPYRAAGWGRKLLGMLMVFPHCLVLATVASVVWHGGRLDPELHATYEHEIAQAIAHRSQATEETLRAALPESFSGHRLVVDWLAKGVAPAPLWNGVLSVWLKEATRLSSAPQFYNDPALQAMARLVVARGVIEREDLEPELRAEVSLRSEVLLLDHGGVDRTVSQRLYDTDLSSQSWSRLVEHALQREDLLRGAELTDDDVRHRFVEGAARVLSKSDYDLDGRLQRKFLQRCQERADLNDTWRSYLAGKPYPAPAQPLDRERFQARYAASIAFDLNAIDRDISQATFAKDLARQNLAYDIIVMEFKRLEAAKAPLPRRWEEFRPPLARIGQAYSDWMSLTPTGDGVSLRRHDPWHGMSLAHRFRGV